MSDRNQEATRQDQLEPSGKAFQKQAFEMDIPGYG
jgi:hypothetical protein